jgi:hypothetical protein
MTLQEKRYKILQLLNSTRKDKARELNKELNPSSKAMSIFNMIGEKMIGVDLDNIEDDDNANAKDQHGGSEQTSVKDEV